MYELENSWDKALAAYDLDIHSNNSSVTSQLGILNVSTVVPLFYNPLFYDSP